ncbi:hypothetical protein MLD38_005408 [Melastoma candidum]|uniref:Uncharacterized protein n=2 Tax=Melastoma candidum TaxID=119954 RepID=A0ACB9RKU5_9MYRT|nr:hypothetical protein MLD38_005408 [Melastoma candidum]
MDLFVNGSDSMRKAGDNPELTLSYLCDKDKGKDPIGRDHDPDPVDAGDGSGSGGGCGAGEGAGAGAGDIVVDDCVNREMHFLNLSDGCNVRVRGCSSKREGHDDDLEGGGREKMSNLGGTLNLSLALPDSSSMLPRRDSDCDAEGRLRSAAPSSNTLMTCSTDFTAPSMSCSYSHSNLFSHNPSCSLTRNSTGNYEHSVRGDRDNQIWHAGEGTNGSVHSRFKPLGDGGGVAFADGGGSNGNGNETDISMNLVTHGSYQISRECSSGFYPKSNSERYSYLPSELPAQHARDVISWDSRGKNLEDSNHLAVGRARKLSRPERLVREIVLQSVPVMSQIVQELSEEVMESTKSYLRSILDVPERSEELAGLQRKLDKRSDLTKETLTKCNKDQLLILVAVRTGLGSFLSGKNKIPNAELVEIFLFLRCRNVNCKMLLPVDDCECKVCSANSGFCSSCMCPVCLKFDCASNTCSWVGCDMCSHWCHASCGIQKNLIRPAQNAKSGAAEMHYFCMGCDHASEMYGFIKDVFSSCAKDWGFESLIKELDCVKKMFRRSEDFKGIELHRMAEELLSRLETRIISPSEACSVIMKFFAGVDSKLAFYDHRVSLDLRIPPTRQSLSKDSTIPLHSSYTRPPILHREMPENFRKEGMKSSLSKERDLEDDFMTMMRKNGFNSLESMIKIKEAEARMFQSRADDARREAEGYKQMIQAKFTKLDEEYARKMSDLCVHEVEERRRKKLDELQLLENSHCDYQKMKMRMQSEITGLIERMEATRKQWG